MIWIGGRWGQLGGKWEGDMDRRKGERGEKQEGDIDRRKGEK